MTAHLQWLAPDVAVLRVFPPGKTYGARYVWCCTIHRAYAEGAVAYGVMQAPTSEMTAAIRLELNKQGIFKLAFERIRDDGSRETHTVQ